MANWLDFEEDSSKKFEEVPVILGTFKGFELPNTEIMPMSGTAIRISSLSDVKSWDRNKLIDLKRSLSKLVNPFGEQLTKYSIAIKAEHEYQKDQDDLREDSDSFIVNGVISNDILNVLEGKTISFRAWLDNECKFLYSELIDRGKLIYKIREEVSYPFSHLKGAKLKVRFFHLNRSARNMFFRRMKIQAVHYGNLMLYKDGFRVFPVGDYKNDYWGLDRRKAQGYARYIGTREIIGVINVNSDSLDFREASSRDKGLVDTPASLALKKASLELLTQFESYVAGVLWKDKLDDGTSNERLMLVQNKSRIIDLIESIASKDNIEILDYDEDLLNIVSNKGDGFEDSIAGLEVIADKIKSNELHTQIEAAKKLIVRSKQERAEALKFAEYEAKQRSEAEKRAEALQAAYEEEQKRSVFISSGVERDKEQLEDFIHQMIIYTADGKSKAEFVNHEINQLAGEEWKDVKSAMIELKEDLAKILLTSRYLTLANFRLTEDLIKEDIVAFCRDHLHVITATYSSRVEPIFEQSSIEFIYGFNPIKFGMVLDNFVANAKRAKATKCHIKCSLENTNLMIRVSDNGVGIAPDVIEPNRIFERGFTRTSGSGIGLHFCKRTVEEMGGSIVLEDAKPGGSFNLLIKFRKYEDRL